VGSKDGVTAETRTDGLTRLVVTVCTHQRNEALDRLLVAIRRNVDNLPPEFAVGVVVVDDNPNGMARSVCERHVNEFPLGLHYRHSGSGNISIARNMGLEAALPISDWIAMTDDDCEPVDTWLASYVTVQAETGSTALTGPCFLEPGPDAPAWLTEQPFRDDAQFRFDDRQRLDVAATNNSFVRTSFLRDRPWLRFDPDLGVTGGEDMVFYRTAHAAGLDIVYSSASKVVGHEPPSRTTFRSQIRSRFWLGNTEYVTNAHLGNGSRVKWLLLSVRRMLVAVTRPFGRLLSLRHPQFHYAIAIGAQAVGIASGAVGLRARHH
jgi:succinoglycan biosynthesis protein ExoM